MKGRGIELTVKILSLISRTKLIFNSEEQRNYTSTLFLNDYFSHTPYLNQKEHVRAFWQKHSSLIFNDSKLKTY